MTVIKEECLKLKKATFYSDRIILHKNRGDITIYIHEIDHLDYARANLWNYIVASGGICPGRLGIWLKMPRAGRKSRYFVKMKHIDFLSLPFDIKRRVDYTVWC